MATTPGPSAPDASVGSVDALKRLRSLETDGAGQLVQLKADGERTLAALREEAETAVTQARAEAERSAEQALLKAQEAAESEARALVGQGERDAAQVHAASSTHILERRDAILDVVIGEFLEAPPALPEE